MLHCKHLKIQLFNNCTTHKPTKAITKPKEGADKPKEGADTRNLSS